MYCLVITMYVLFVFALTFFFNKFLLKHFRGFGVNNNAEEIRWNTKKPAIGGITFYLAFLFSCLTLMYTIFNKEFFYFRQFYGIVIAVTIGFLSGLYDDAYNTIPWLKFILQVLCAVALISTGTYIKLFEITYVDYFLTIFWVVGIMNAINLLDNMDAIASSVSLFIILSMILAMFAFPSIDRNYFLLLLTVAVAIISFLIFNWHPSKMYMGDSGAMFLGALMASFGILFFWNYQISEQQQAPFIVKVLASVIIFALPIIDTTTVFIKRLVINKKSPFVGGRDHTTHHFSYLGFSDRKVAWIFIAASFLSSLMGLLVLHNASRWNAFFAIAFSMYFIFLFTIFFVVANLNTHKNAN